MTHLNQIYKCSICGNIVEVVRSGNGELVCCGQPMELKRENSVDAAKEKHVPIIEKNGRSVLVKVGSAPHPMEEEHFIEWIEIIVGGKTYRQFLKPGYEPQAKFHITGNHVQARAYCNLHGLWKSE
jgi:superoxide reductase